MQHEDEASKPSLFSKVCRKTQCLFYFINTSQFYEVQLHNFAIIYKMRNHVKLHLKTYKLNDQISCPDFQCKKTAVLLNELLHFKNHAA